MPPTPVPSLDFHRVQAASPQDLLAGQVRYSPAKSLWLLGHAAGAVAGAWFYFSLSSITVFLLATGAVLLLGHSLGSHRLLIHGSYRCPRWLARVLVYLGVQVGLAGPLSLLRQHELRDYAQRLPDCHPYLRHGTTFWRDAWWQLHCELHLTRPPRLSIEPRLAEDRFYAWLDRTWMWQQLPPAVLLLALGGWGWVCWGVCARICAGVIGHWLIGHFAHNAGGMHHVVEGAAVQGRNIRWTSLLTMGESWHNNHHAFPGSARLGLQAGEWDPGWWMLLALRHAGLVWDLRLPQDLPARAELRALTPLPAPAHPSLGGWRDLPALRGQLRATAGRTLHLQGPEASMPARWLQALTGQKLHVDKQLARLELHDPTVGIVVRGLPALCVAVARRGAAAHAIARALLPAAAALESARVRLTVA